MNEIVDILHLRQLLGRRGAHRLAADLRHLGELICERAGVLNLGIEGIMVVGAFAGWMAVYAGAGLWWGVGVACSSAWCSGCLHAMLTVPFGLSQHVVGLGITLLATSSSYYAYRLMPAGGDLAAPDRAVPAARYPGPFRHPVHRRGAVLADAADLPRLRSVVASDRLRALPHAAGPRRARGGRKPGRRRGAGALGRRRCGSAR